MPEGQPYCLHALQCLSECLGDRDRALRHCLLQGVPTGYDGDIPPSNVFLPALPSEDRTELAVCFGNWNGVEDFPALLQSLVQEEMDKGYLGEVASLAYAQQRCTDRVAVGRMNVVQAPGKAPRLLVDSSVCGTNGTCYVPESYQLPLLECIRFSSPMRECSSVIGGFSLDIRAAHKTVRVRERDRGLLGGWRFLSLLLLQGVPFRGYFQLPLVSTCFRLPCEISSRSDLGATYAYDVFR